MNIRYLALIALIACLLAAPVRSVNGLSAINDKQEEEGKAREFSIVIDKPEAEYTVETGGTMDPENLEITIENLSDGPVVNPRLTVNGLYDWYDAQSLAAEITRDCRTDEVKALAIWWWMLYRTFQRSPHDDSALHPVRAMNGYGYGICGHNSAWMKSLWSAAGLKARVQELWGHTVSEAYYNGGWHMLDSNVKVFYLDRDNRSIASLATIERDKWLIERTIHPQDPWFRSPDPPERIAQFVRYLTSYKDNFEEHGYDSEIAKDYSMAMTLKPGEKLVRWWNPALGKFEGRDRRAEVPEMYANGQLIWEPDLKRVDLKPYIHVIDNVTTRGQDGRSPAIHIAELQDDLHTRPSRFTLPIHSPYPIVGGRFWCTLIKEGASDLDQAAIFFGEPGWESGNLYTFRWGKGSKKVEMDLDSNILRGGATHSYSIGFNMRGNAASDLSTQAGVDHFRLVTDLQVSPHSLPALALGKNIVRFRHQSPGNVKVRITHRWREVNGQRPPGKVEEAIVPVDAAESLTPTLKWRPAMDPDAGDKVIDYQVMVSLRPDCRWPLSPTLHQNVGSEKTEWKTPTTFLNPGTTYYWKVRARDNHGNIGPWSRVFHFRTTNQPK